MAPELHPTPHMPASGNSQFVFSCSAHLTVLSSELDTTAPLSELRATLRTKPVWPWSANLHAPDVRSQTLGGVTAISFGVSLGVWVGVGGGFFWGLGVWGFGGGWGLGLGGGGGLVPLGGELLDVHVAPCGQSPMITSYL